MILNRFVGTEYSLYANCIMQKYGETLCFFDPRYPNTLERTFITFGCSKGSPNSRRYGNRNLSE